MRIWLAQINPTIGDFKGNTQKILERIPKAIESHADILLFSELAICGYPPEDFLLHPEFIEQAEECLKQIAKVTPSSLTVIVGIPRVNSNWEEKPCFNSAAVVRGGQVIGYQDKMLLPTYDVFDEKRFFESGVEIKLCSIAGKKVAITVCEDIWEHSDLLRYTFYRRDPISEVEAMQPDLVLNLSSSPYSTEKLHNRIEVGVKVAQTLSCPVILCNQVGANDSLIFDGYSYVLNSQGKLVQHAKGFQEDDLLIDTDKLPDPISLNLQHAENLYDALILGIRDYFFKSGFKKACFGLSGGIDSALVACLAAAALGPENVLAVTMPSRYSSTGSVTDSQILTKKLGIELLDISIESPFSCYLNLLEPYFKKLPQDVTEENMQARIRGIILMALSNKFGYIVLSTGNKSEMAMGYSTLYGDMVGGLGVISDVTKTQVYELAKWINRNEEIIPQAIIEKPPSAELRPDQKDTDTLPPYEIVDNVLKSYVEDLLSPDKIAQKFNYPIDIVQSLIKKIHQNEYKRRQAPPSLRISEKAFTVGRKFPIVQKWV